MTENRRAILSALWHLESSGVRSAFTIKELEQAAPEVNAKTLRYHLASYMADGKYHNGHGTQEVEQVGKQGRAYTYRLTSKGRSAAKELING